MDVSDEALISKGWTKHTIQDPKQDQGIATSDDVGITTKIVRIIIGFIALVIVLTAIVVLPYIIFPYIFSYIPH